MSSNTAEIVRQELANFVQRINTVLVPGWDGVDRRRNPWNGVDRRERHGAAPPAAQSNDMSTAPVQTAEAPAFALPIAAASETPAERRRGRPRKTSKPFGINRKTSPFYATDRKRVPSDLSPRLQSVMKEVMRHSRPVSDQQIAKKLDVTIAAAHLALWRLRKKKLVTMVETD
jgi:hypothetical protein